MARSVTILFLALGCSAAPAPTPSHAESSGDPPARLASAQSLYFESNHGTGAQFTELRVDGTYRTVSREHMFVGETDAGRWRQEAQGEVLLCSEYEYRYITAPPLWIVVGSRERYDNLPHVRDTIRETMTKGSSFATKEVEQLGVASDEYGDARTSRESLGRLAAAIDDYLGGGDETLFRTWAHAYRGVVYLDADWTIPRQTHDAEWLFEAHRSLDNHDGMLVIASISAAAFDDATTRPQPFVFHKEMNDCIGRAGIAPHDMKGARVAPRCKRF